MAACAVPNTDLWQASRICRSFLSSIDAPRLVVGHGISGLATARGRFENTPVLCGPAVTGKRRGGCTLATDARSGFS